MIKVSEKRENPETVDISTISGLTNKSDTY